MKTPIHKRVAKKYAQQKSIRTAGEVRFIKDQSGKENGPNWAYPGYKPSVQRQIQKNFVFNPTQLKPLAKSLRSGLMALGHATSAYNTFVKIKSRNISPDGNLGGLGYSMEITNIRKNLMNVIEALSAITDCIYDEVHAPHWNPEEDELHPRDRREVIEIVKQVNDIQQDPEEYAEEVEEELDEEVDEIVEEESYDELSEDDSVSFEENGAKLVEFPESEV